MPARPPLTKAELQAIKQRNAGNPDMAALLWEIHRLRGLVLRSNDYFRQPGSSSTASAMAESLRNDLAVEPAVLEQPKL